MLKVGKERRDDDILVYGIYMNMYGTLYSYAWCLHSWLYLESIYSGRCAHRNGIICLCGQKLGLYRSEVEPKTEMGTWVTNEVVEWFAVSVQYFRHKLRSSKIPIYVCTVFCTEILADIHERAEESNIKG